MTAILARTNNNGDDHANNNHDHANNNGNDNDNGNGNGSTKDGRAKGIRANYGRPFNHRTAIGVMHEARRDNERKLN